MKKIEITIQNIWMASRKTITKNKKKYSRKIKWKGKDRNDG